MIQNQQQLIARLIATHPPEKNQQQANQSIVNATLLPSFENFDAKKESSGTIVNDLKITYK